MTLFSATQTPPTPHKNLYHRLQFCCVPRKWNAFTEMVSCHISVTARHVWIETTNDAFPVKDPHYPLSKNGVCVPISTLAASYSRRVSGPHHVVCISGQQFHRKIPDDSYQQALEQCFIEIKRCAMPLSSINATSRSCRFD